MRAGESAVRAGESAVRGGGVCSEGWWSVQ